MQRLWKDLMAKKYRVTLSAAERDELTALIRKGKADARKRAPARVLLQVDESASGSSGADEQTAGKSRWTLRLLAEQAVELKIVATVSHESVRQALKKTNSSRT